MINLKTLTGLDSVTSEEKNQIADFLVINLGAYGDPKDDIIKCLDFALDPKLSTKGFLVIAEKDEEIVGVLVMNKTGMSGFIPENILVYIAVNSNMRGKGIGKQLMDHAITISDGAIALHVEANNPAKMLYERLGFTNKYLEMRLIK
jgi:ribosomal-protein-alanine N-acetyltransferase